MTDLLATLKELTEEAINTIEAISEIVWDKRRPDECLRAVQHASELAGCYDVFRARFTVLTAQIEAVEKDGWQPIETSPKTTRSRLVYCPALQNQYLVTWRSGGDREGWWLFGGGFLMESATHWRPRPAPPVSP